MRYAWVLAVAVASSVVACSVELGGPPMMFDSGIDGGADVTLGDTGLDTGPDVQDATLADVADSPSDGPTDAASDVKDSGPDSGPDVQDATLADVADSPSDGPTDAASDVKDSGPDPDAGAPPGDASDNG